MIKSGKVRFEEAPQSQSEESSNQILMDALQIDDSSSISDTTRVEASFMSEGNVNRYNFIGRTPHAKVIEAEESKKRLKELTKLMTMAPLSQTPVRISVPISDISPQSDISMSPAMDQSQYSSVASTPAEMIPEVDRNTPAENLSTYSKGIAIEASSSDIAMVKSTPAMDRSQQSLPTPQTTTSNVSSDASFNIVESLGVENQNQPPSGGFSISTPAVAPSQPSVMNTPSTIHGSAPASIAKRSSKANRTPFSDISNRSAPSLNEREEEEEIFDASAQKTVINKSVSFQRSQISSAAKTKKTKAPVTPYAKIECSESEDGESDVDCNAIVVSHMQCPSPSVHSIVNQENSIVEKKLFLNSSEKQKPLSDCAQSPSDASITSLKSSPTSMSMGIAAIPIQRKTKEESRDWHGGLELAKETIPTELIQTQYIIVPAPRPVTNDAATMYSPMATTVPPSPMTDSASAQVMVTFSPVQSSPISSEVSKLATELPVATAQCSLGLPPIPPAPTTYVAQYVQYAPSYVSSSTSTTVSASSAITTTRPNAADLNFGVSFGKGPTSTCIQAKRVEMKQHEASFKNAGPIVSPVESKLMAEVEKPVVSVCSANLHPAKAFYSPNNTRKVQQMFGDAQIRVDHHQNSQLHERSQQLTTAERPSIIIAADVSYDNHHAYNPSLHQPTSIDMSHPSLPFLQPAGSEVVKMNVTTATAGTNTVNDCEKVIYVTQTSPTKSMLSTSTISEYQQDLSSIRAMDVSIQVDSTMFHQPKKDVCVVQEEKTISNSSAVNTPSSVQTDPMSQSVLLKSATKSSSSGVFNESITSHASSYYYAASGENDETADDTEKSFALADLLPPTATRTGLGKGLFPNDNLIKQTSIVPSSLSNPWVYRVGFDSRLCNVGSQMTTATSSTTTKTSPLMMSSTASQKSWFVGTGALGKPQRIRIEGPDVDKKQQLIDQWNESYYQDDQEDDDDVSSEQKSRDVIFKEEIEQRFAASRGTASTVTVDRTMMYRSNALDLTMRSDVAVATYTRQSVDSAADESYMTTGADTTFTLDQSYMTKTTLMSHEEVIPRFAIKSLKRSADESFEVKEINFETAPGEYTTIMMVFDNNRPHPVTLKAQTALVRVEPMSSTRANYQEGWDALAEELMNEKNEYFTVSPGEITIPPFKEGSLFITFAPALGVEGIYSGAMRIKHDRKSYTLLLRGESAMRHSVHSTPATTMSAHSPSAIPEHIVISAATAVDVSQFPNNQSQLSWTKATSGNENNATGTAAAAAAAAAAGVSTTALELSSVMLPEASTRHARYSNQKKFDQAGNAKNLSSTMFSTSSIVEESAFSSATFAVPTQSAAPINTEMENDGIACEFFAPPVESVTSPASTLFQDRLRALHERIAALSCKVLWKHIPSPSQPGSVEGMFSNSPAASEATSAGLQVEPEMLKIENNMDSYHTIRLINPEVNRTMMVKIKSSHACVRVSTTMLSINPDAEACVLVKIDRVSLLQHFGEAMYKASMSKNSVALDNWCCGALTLQYDSDLEVTVSVVLNASMVQEVISHYEHQNFQQQQQHVSVTSTPATTAQQRHMTSSSKTSRLSGTPMILNASDYHHQLQYHTIEDELLETTGVTYEKSAMKSVKSAKSSVSRVAKAVSSYQKPPLAAHPAPTKHTAVVGGDNVSVTSTISSHPASIQFAHNKRVRQGSVSSQATSSTSTSAVSMSSSMKPVKQQQATFGNSMLSVPDLSLVSTTSSMMRGATKGSKLSSQIEQGSKQTQMDTKDRTHLLVGKRRGLFFENVTAMFGSVMIGCLVRSRVILANASNEEAVVYLGDVDVPFLITKNEVRLKPRSYVRVPVQFLPTKAGHYQAELIAQSANGAHTTSIKLSGHCYA